MKSDPLIKLYMVYCNSDRFAMPCIDPQLPPCSPGMSSEIVQHVTSARNEKDDWLAKLSIYQSVDNQTVLKHENGAFKVLPRSNSPWNPQIQWDNERLNCLSNYLFRFEYANHLILIFVWFDWPQDESPKIALSSCQGPGKPLWPMALNLSGCMRNLTGSLTLVIP